MVDPDVTRLEAEERYARERHDLYRAKTYGTRQTNPSRLRGLARAAELAQQRLRLALSRSKNTS